VGTPKAACAEKGRTGSPPEAGVSGAALARGLGFAPSAACAAGPMRGTADAEGDGGAEALPGSACGGNAEGGRAGRAWGMGMLNPDLRLLEASTASS
jgi:hypothetical protein